MTCLPKFTKFKTAAYSYVWSKDVEHLLPQHYKERCLDFMTREPVAVHWRPVPGRWKIDPKSGQRVPVQNVPIRIIYPQECNKGLWGGEGIIQGLLKKKPQVRRLPKIWKPFLQKRPIYSEILNKWFAITVTLRTLSQIDEKNGFDHYILKTHERDLNSKLGMDLKRKMLLALVRNTMYPDDPEKRQKTHNIYKEYIIPEEEAKWVGLSVREALKKVRQMEENNPPPPLKDIFKEELIAKLLAPDESIKEKGNSWMKKLNPFIDESKKS